MAVGPRMIALALITRLSADERRALVAQIIHETTDPDLAACAVGAGRTRLSELCAPHVAGRLCDGATDA